MEMKKVLVVCHGNLNRSAAGEIILKKMAPHLDVKSAGMHTTPGRITAKKMREALNECGYDQTSIRTTQIDQEMINWADVIVYMDHKNEEKLVAMFGQSVLLKSVKISTLIGRDKIPDPHFSKTNDAHIAVVKMLEDAFSAMLAAAELNKRMN